MLTSGPTVQNGTTTDPSPISTSPSIIASGETRASGEMRAAVIHGRCRCSDLMNARTFAIAARGSSDSMKRQPPRTSAGAEPAGTITRQPWRDARERRVSADISRVTKYRNRSCSSSSAATPSSVTSPFPGTPIARRISCSWQAARIKSDSILQTPLVILHEGIDKGVERLRCSIRLGRLKLPDHADVIVVRVKPRMRMGEETEVATLCQRRVKGVVSPHLRAVADVQEIVNMDDSIRIHAGR